MTFQIKRSQLPQPCPSFIELEGDAFLRRPSVKDEEVIPGIDQLLAMTPTERLQWHATWRRFIRQCLRQGWMPEMIAATVWGDTKADESQ